MLHLLGPPHLSRGDDRQALPPSISLLVAVLSLKFGGFAGKGDLAGFLFEGARNPANSLRQVLWRVRRFEQQNAVRLLLAEGAHVRRDGSCLESDLDILQRMASVESSDDLERLLDIAAGELLAGLDPQGSELRQWLQVERTLVENALVQRAMSGIHRFPGSTADRLFKAIGARSRPATISIEEAGDPYPSVAHGIPVPRPRIALLPPTLERVGSPADHLIATTFVEDVNEALFRLREVETVAPYSVARLRPGHEIDDLIRMGTGFAVASALIDRGHGITLLLTLIELGTGAQLWRNEVDLWSGASQVTLDAIAASIAIEVCDSIARREVERTGLVSRSAYSYLAHGRKALARLDLPDIRRSKGLFRHAIDIAPGYGTAHVMLSRALSLEWVLLGRDDRGLLDAAAKEADIALGIDPLDAAAHREMARVSLFRTGLDDSVAHYAMAERLAPHHADILADSADTLVHASRFAEADQRMEIAMHLNPLAPDEYRWTAGAIRFFLEDFVGALKILGSMRNPAPAARLMAASAAMLGDKRATGKFRRLALENHPDFTIESWMKLMPQADAADARFYVEALKKAGFRLR